MIRLSVTDLESWRYLKASDDATPEQILTRLRHEEPTTHQMEAGRAFAKLMERAQAGEIYSEVVDGWWFDFSRMSGTLFIPPIRELKGEIVIPTPHGPVTLVGKVDGLDALVVHDQKLTERWDAERYTESLQWRSYLHMFNARAFTYDVFLGRYDRDGAKRVEIVEFHPFTFHRYPGLEADVVGAVTELAGIVATYIPDRILTEAA